MIVSTILVTLVGFAASLAVAVPTIAARSPPFPLTDGFPDPSPSQLLKIQSLAGGTVPDGSVPKSISEAGLTNLRLIAFNEIFEVAFFTDLLANITSNSTGYTDFGIFSRTFVIDSLTAVVNQEQIHAVTANSALAACNAVPIIPCTYTFPVSNFDDALSLAATFTDVVLGTLQSAQLAFAVNNDTNLVPFIGAVIGQEGEQNGFYRIVQQKRPSSSPFLTTSAGTFAFSALQSFIISESCPNIDTIKIPTLQHLEITMMLPVPVNQTLEFKISGKPNMEGMYVVYISGRNVPVVEPINHISVAGNETKFMAYMPFQGVEAMFSEGLTIAALTKGSGPFSSVADVADAAVYGPALIEIG